MPVTFSGAIEVEAFFIASSAATLSYGSILVRSPAAHPFRPLRLQIAMTGGPADKKLDSQKEENMYTQEEKKKAVELFINSGYSTSAVISTLGYPSRNILRRWYQSYLKNDGILPLPKRKYSEEYKQSVIESYYSNGENISLTAKQNGIPYSTLNDWLQERKIFHKPDCISGTDVVKYGDEHKLMAVTEANCNTEPNFRICAKYGISETTLYNWRRQLLGKDSSVEMAKTKKAAAPKQYKPSNELQNDELQHEYEVLRQELADKEAQLHKVSLERDVLKETLQILKK